MTAPALWGDESTSAARLADGDVHVWRVPLNAPAWCVRELEGTLTPDECARADRFFFPGHRERFVVARAALRAILGAYAAEAPSRLRFSYGPHGKPRLARSANGEDLRFNASRSEGVALVAVTRARELGVDVERVRPEWADELLAGRAFSRAEAAALAALPAGERRAAVFSYWVAKEAYLKATGGGLGRALDGFDVLVVSGEPVVGLRVAGDARETARWALRALSPVGGYAAAIAVEGHSWRLRCWEWTPQRAGRDHRTERVPAGCSGS